MRNSKGQFIKGSKPTHGFKKGIKVWNKGLKGIHLNPETEFKKGIIPWNKDTKGLVKANSGSIKNGERKNIKTEFKTETSKNEKNINWKGDKVGYFGLHTWIQRNLGKANFCQNRKEQFLLFKCNVKSKTYHWANRSRQYKRKLTDWISLCVSCHLKADRRKMDL